MARVTVEDCIERIPNRFELVMTASQRVRDINAGAPITVDRDRDKNPVVALREIADDTISTDELKESLIKRNQRLFETVEETEEQIDVIEGEEVWANMSRDALESEESGMDFDGEDDAAERNVALDADTDVEETIAGDASDDENF